jgi:hypothetical protein
MPQDLTVQQGTQVILNGNPPQEIAAALQRVSINKLQDLVDVGAVGSREALDSLLDSAKRASSSAIRLRDTYTPMVLVPGTMLPDLRRFGAFRAAAPEVHTADAQIFWRLARGIPATALATVTPATDLSAMVSPRLLEILVYLFRDVEVQSNSVLTLDAAIQVFQCGNLTIRTGGRIVVQGSGIVIKAFSIQGNV